MTTPPPVPNELPTAGLPPAEPPQPAPPSRRRTLTTGLIGAIIGAALTGTAWYGTSNGGDNTPTTGASDTAKPAAEEAEADPNTFDLTGDFTLTDGAISDGTGGCEGTGGYEDISLGTSVTVYDAAGAVIATDMLVLSEYDAAAGTCTFDVSVADVPTGHEFYQVEISHRGKIQLSAEEAQSGAFGGTLG